jgi:hypothetical protein
MFGTKARAGRTPATYFALMRASIDGQEKIADMRQVVDAQSGETRSSVYEAMRTRLCAYFGCKDAPGELQVIEFSIDPNELSQ